MGNLDLLGLHCCRFCYDLKAASNQ